MQLDSYKRKESRTKSHLQGIKKIACEMNMANAANKIDEIMHRMDADIFHLVVVGEFSRGKSTFVNALLGKRILPASKNPTTAIISKLVYGDVPSYRVFYKNQKQENMEEAAFKKLTAPPEPDESDPASVRDFVKAQRHIAEIDFVEITYPLPFCKENVEVVDTPGTNDLNVGRMEITYGYLNQADAVILLLAAYQPLTASEVQFLKERILGNQIQDIFFVISHKDDLDDAEQEKDVVNFIAKHLRDVLPQGFNLQKHIFLVNSLGSLYFHMQERGEELTVKQELKVPDSLDDTGFTEFEASLGDFLANEKGMARLRKYNRETQTIIQTMHHDISVNIGFVSHSTDDIRKKVAELAPKFQQAKRKVNHIISDMQMSLEIAGKDIEYKCYTAANTILSKAKEAIENLTQDMSVTTMQQTIEREVSVEKKHFMDAMLKEWQDVFQREIRKANESLRYIWKDIDIEYNREFNLSSLLENSSSELVIPDSDNNKSFYEQAYSFAENMFQGAMKNDSMLGFIGGVGISAVAGAIGVGAEIFSAFSGGGREAWRDKVRSEVVRTYSSQGERMATVMRTFYRARTDAICKNFQDNIDARITDMESQLQDIIREREFQEQDVEKKKSYLLSKQSELCDISREMNRLML